MEKYESLFFQISMDDAVKILSKLISKEEIKNVYAELISAENYKILREKNKKLFNFNFLCLKQKSFHLLKTQYFLILFEPFQLPLLQY